MKVHVGIVKEELVNNNDIKISKKQLLAIGIFVFIVLIIIIIVIFAEKKPETNSEPSIEEIAAKEQIELGNSEREKWPIIQQLPTKNSLFTIGYIVEGDTFIINIVATSTYLDQAVAKLKKLDSDVGRYDINIKDFENPFDVDLTESSALDPQEFLTQVFRNARKEFLVKSGKEFEEYYCAIITTGDVSRYNLITYRTVLRRDGLSWKVLVKPTPVVTYKNAPEVPDAVRKIVNGLD